MLSCEGIRRSHAVRRPLPRRRQRCGGPAALAAAYLAALSFAAPTLAKTPGEVHCYNGICHRVKTVEEMALIVGHEHDAVTSYYDTADRDSMNAGTITSSGEPFDARSESHAASSLYPDGTELLIWNPKNRHAAHIRVNDFGPFYMLRTIDVTRRVAELLDFSKTGVARLRVAVVWAPSPEAARFRRRRTYPAVEGYVGRLDYDQFVALKSRLIATGPARNPAPIMVAASFTALPAFAGATAGPAERIKVAVLNAPRMTLNSKGPALTIKPVRATLPVRALTPAHALTSPARPAPAIIASRDAGAAPLGETIEPRSGESVVATSLAPASREATDDATPRSAALETGGGRPWMPHGLLWQQVLAAIAFLTLVTAGWRTRAFGSRVRVDSAGQVRSQILAPVFAGGVEAHVDAGEPPADMDRASRALAGKPIDALRDEAIAHMEAYAFRAAEASYRKLHAERERALGPNDPMTANAERQLADCLREQGRYAAAEPHYRHALATMVRAAGELHAATAEVLDEFAVCQLRQGRGAEAERTVRQSLAVRRNNDATSREYAATLSILAETLRAQGQLGAAETKHRMALARFIALSGEDGLDAAVSRTSIGTVLGELGRFGPAEDMLNAGTRILSSACGHDHPVSATGYALLGDLYRRAGALDAARTMQMHALGIRESRLGERHPDTIETLLSLALIATEQYRIGDARLLLDRALDSLVAGERNNLGPQSRVRALLVTLSHQHDVSQPLKAAAE